MSSESDSDSDLETFVESFRAVQQKLKDINISLTQSIESLKVVRKVAKTVEGMCEQKDTYTEFPDLRKYLKRWERGETVES